MNEVFNFLNNKLLIKDGDIIVIGNSSGPDSMALCFILQQIRKQKQIRIICAHVNHNVREQSKIEEEFLEKYCIENDIVFEHMKIEKYGDDNFHNEARKIRYNFFDDIVKKYNANYLMTAHHADDLMETILMRIVRGSSLKGYAGFSQIVDKDSYKIVRPLIFVTKQQLEEYDKENKIPYYIDQSNFKTKYTRNRYRKVVLPFLKEEDINVHQKFLKFSKLLLECDKYIDSEVSKEFNKICNDNTLDINMYGKLSDLLKYKIISKFLEKEYQDDLIIINDSHIELVQNLISSKKKNSFINLPNDVVIYKSYDKLIIKTQIDEICDYEIEFNGYAKLLNGHIIENVEEAESNDNNICRIDKNEINFPLYIRTRREGDKIELKKINGSRKIKDIFIDEKIPLNERDRWPIVVDSKGIIIWIPGVKKSKFTKTKNEKYDIILKYN